MASGGDSMASLLLVGGMLVGGYYLVTSGLLQSLLSGAGGYSNALPTGPADGDVSLEGDTIEAAVPPPVTNYPGGKDVVGGIEGAVIRRTSRDDDDDRKKKRRRKNDDDDDDDERYQVYMPQQQQYQPPPQPIYRGTPVPPPPGMLSSLYPLPVAQNAPPPYVSQTVGTYSPYSPYNQFNVYREYQTPSTGQMQTMPDDNVGFTDIDTTRAACAYCKNLCIANPYGSSCRRCRMPCKKVTHYYVPSQTGWTIGPVGTLPAQTYSPYYPPATQSYLGMLADNIRGAVFADMDDYHRGRRFDCHNKLKRRVKGKDNSFVTQEDYYYDRNNIDINVE